MLDLLASAAAFTAVVALALGALAALTLVPFALSLRLAERRGADPARVGAAALAGSVLGLGLIALRSPVTVVLGIALAAATPVLLGVLPQGSRVAGRSGRHQ